MGTHGCATRITPRDTGATVQAFVTKEKCCISSARDGEQKAIEMIAHESMRCFMMDTLSKTEKYSFDV
jgi:hypothetical protein